MVKIFDIETDGLLPDVSQVWCVAVDTSLYTDVWKAIEELNEADLIVGHNIISYDLPVLKKLCGWEPKCPVYDTLLMSKLTWPDVFTTDIGRVKSGILDKDLTGSYSLKAFGQRLGFPKGDYTDWTHYTAGMGAYCLRDVQVTHKLYERILNKRMVSQEAGELEQIVRNILTRQETYGVLFDTHKALRFYDELLMETMILQEEIKDSFYNFFDYSEFIPKVNNSTHGYIKGVPITKVKETEFNPNSRQHIVRGLQEKYGWEPTEFTEKGNPRMDESVLSELDYPECISLTKYLGIKKLMGMLHDGKNGWIKLTDKHGRIHGHVDTLGAVTRRMTHNKPNLGQVPAHSKLGARCRELFVAPEGKVLVGADASGLEIRMLAHYMNDPTYTDVILNGDIHTTNMEALGITDRDVAKTFFYGWCYGAGNEKLGNILGVTPRKASEIRAKFLRSIPSLEALITKVKQEAKGKFLNSLDNQPIHVRSEHSALNTLLQSAGAIVMKRALVIAAPKVYKLGGEYVLNVHDETVIECLPEVADEILNISIEAIKEAGEYYNLNCPLDADGAIGHCWREVH